ncbi:MAG: 50S ribosomal protein L2 [Candidatus Nealsonbacteria bacterium]|nr:50S ribosomal protein L2 [Candidatus Nealsonbacteria bacterium]
MSKQTLTKERPVKKLVVNLKRRAGRGSSGRITIRHKGGGVKRLYRLVDFKMRKIDVPAKVLRFEYDPYRTAYIALIEYQDGEKSYILAPQGMKEGDEIIVSEKAELKVGNRMKLKNVPVGSSVFNIELEPGKGGQLIKSAGSSSKVLAHDGKYIQIEMPSKEVRKIHKECYGTIGAVSNPEHKYKRIKNAGASRRKGKRPTVRGSAMNPVDHPHGGGEGRAPIGLKYAKTPWGKHARGVKTRKRKTTNHLIIKRRKKKKR